MECVVQVVRGSNLDTENKTCVFCGANANNIFCITSGKKYDGTALQGFGICTEHKEKINALLSGEFDIDMIYLDRFKKTTAKKVNLRRMPPMNIAKTDNKKTLKTCEFFGCTNKFRGIEVQRYCRDKRCVEARKAATKKIGRKRLKEKDVSNIIIEKKKLGNHIKDGQVLRINCRAVDCNNKRCKNHFIITFNNNRKVYPKFCEEHRSAYKRSRFHMQKGTDA